SMGLDGLQQVAGSSIMQEEDPLPKPPQRSGAKFVGPGSSLGNPVAEDPHVVHEQVREQIGGLEPQRRRRVVASRHRADVASRTTDAVEQRASVINGRRTAHPYGAGGGRRREEPHKVGKADRVARDGLRLRTLEISVVVGRADNLANLWVRSTALA